MFTSDRFSLHLVFVVALTHCSSEVVLAIKVIQQLRGASCCSSNSRLGTCKALTAEEEADFEYFKQLFDRRIDVAKKMYSNKWFASWFQSRLLNTHLLESNAAPQGLWLKFGIDMSCDTGACDKIEPLAQHAATKPGTRVYAFDCFQGLPERWREGFPQGKFARQEIPTPPLGVQWVKGIFQESLPRFLAQHEGEKIGYLLVDSDLCSSAEFILDQTYPHLANDALVYFDEIMNFETWETGELLAFHRFLKKRNLDYDVVMAASNCELRPQHDYAYNQQAAFRLKRANAHQAEV